MTNGPSGLLSLTGVHVVDTGTVTLDSLGPVPRGEGCCSRRWRGAVGVHFLPLMWR